jgi:ABC-type oligopeptide transport system substrate-binding subunit
MKNTEIAINRAKNLVREIKKDLGKGYIDVAKLNLKYLEEDLFSIREQLAYDVQSSYEMGEEAGRSQIKARHDADERLDAAMTEAHTTIGTFFEDLRAIYEPKEGSGPTHG